MNGAMTFNPSLSFPGSFPIYCECNDSPNPLSISCSSSCATAGRTGPKRVFVTVSANQAFTPIVSWPGAPTTISSSTDIRIQ
jgi:hypothetical protein